ncbi:MAG: hypothetical protein IJV98_00160 [Clostridia bacterium]|nr:hypothetical protein [Clostridia bacterium]
MYFYIIIAVFSILIGIWNLMIAVLGCFPRFRADAIGTLTRAKTEKNVPAKYGRIPVQTRYVYVYTVNGRQYRYAGENRHVKRRLLPKITMVYVKWFPRHAYPNKFKATTEWVLGSLMLLTGVICILIVLEGI